MKKLSVSILASTLAAAAVFAAQNDLLVSFSTKGPDTYADGSTVLDGECYALVWTPLKANGAALAADGSATGGMEIVLVAPVAKKGHCPNIVYRVAADKVERKYPQGKGSWSVYLLDTRKFSRDEAGNDVVSLAGLDAGGNVKLVNASSKAGDASLNAGVGDNTSLATSLATCATTSSALPQDVPEAKIAAMEIVGGNVYVTVENAAPYLAYDLAGGATPDDVNAPANRPATGGDDGTVILVAPVNDSGSGFFRLKRSEPGF